MHALETVIRAEIVMKKIYSLTAALSAAASFKINLLGSLRLTLSVLLNGSELSYLMSFHV